MLVILLSVAIIYATSHAQAFCIASGTLPNHRQLRLDTVAVEEVQALAVLSDGDVSLAVPHKTSKTFPKIKSLVQKISFSWTKPLLSLGNRRSLELSDLWTLDNEHQMHVTSQQFQIFFEKELRRQRKFDKQKEPNMFYQFWSSPILRAVVKMNRKEFIVSGIIKAINSVVQFIPSLLVSRILKIVGTIRKDSAVAAMQTTEGFVLASILFVTLTAKTAIENVYFDMVTNLAAQIRGTLSAAIYQKALRLGPEGRQNVTLGEVVNFMQIDTTRLEYVAGSIHTFWDGIFQIMGYTGLLLHFLGPAVFAGILAMVFIIPFNAIFLQKLSHLREENLKEADHRVKLTNEILHGIRAIKSFNWEKPFEKKLEDTRDNELRWIQAAANIRGILIAALIAAPSFVAVFSLSYYAYLGNSVEPAKVFTALALFNQLRFPLTFFPLLINSLAEGKISLQRLSRFFQLKEVENYVQRQLPTNISNDVAVAVDNGHFSWTAADAKSLGHTATNTSSPAWDQRSHLRDVNIRIKEGELVAVIGPTGCGKTSLLQALLGEMIKQDGNVTVTGRVAYVPQNLWIPNESLQNVILFGREMEPSRYFNALRVCGLLKDLDQMPARDETEIGERGTNLSGGQKQRTSLARAVYEDADVYLLDDPLSALDNEVSFAVFRDCIKVALRKKTRILVTHNVNILPDANRIILMGPADASTGCRIVDQGTLRELLIRGHDLRNYVQQPSAPHASSSVTGAHSSEPSHNAAYVATRMSEQSSSCDATELDSKMSSINAVTSPVVTVVPSSVDVLDRAPDYFVESRLEDLGSSVTAAGSMEIEDARTTPLSSQRDAQDSQVASDIASSAILTPEEKIEVLASSGSGNSGSSSSSSSSNGNIRIPTAQIPAARSILSIKDKSWRRGVDQRDTFEAEYAEFLAKSAQLQTQTQRLAAKQLMTKEERIGGIRSAVDLPMYKSYLLESKKPLLLAIIALAFLMTNVTQLWQQWIVAAWTSDVGYVKRPLYVYLSGVALMASGVACFTWLRSYVGILLGAAISKNLHTQMVQRTLRAPLSFFESTPVGRLIQRFSKDLDQIDQQLPGSMAQLISSSLSIASSMMAICLVTPNFALVMAPILVIYFRITNYYRPVARELKRLDFVSRSPIYSHFSETLNGLSVIRAFRRLEIFRRVNAGRLDDNLAAYLALKLTDRWMSFRLEILGNLVVLAAALLAVWSGSKAGSTGLSLTNALGVTSMLNWAVRNAADTEALMHSVERVYSTIRETPQEAAAEVSAIPSTAFMLESCSLASQAFDSRRVVPQSDAELKASGWPWAGAISFRNVSMRYRSDFAPVLRGVSLHIRPGERIGIVGRTGSGKSSLFRSLQRLSEVDDGQVLIDGVNIAQVGIDLVRSVMTIIPQDPVLFSASIRENLDPHNEYSNSQLWSALYRSNLGQLVDSLPDRLESRVSEGGENFSAGQRQLLCLARALVRKSKILLLDEATSAVDFETDALIQRTIRQQSFQDVTILTIAHRLDTVLDADRIVVIDQGRVIEFDTPANLLRDTRSVFTQLVNMEYHQKQQQQLRHQQHSSVPY